MGLLICSKDSFAEHPSSQKICSLKILLCPWCKYNFMYLGGRRNTPGEHSIFSMLLVATPGLLSLHPLDHHRK